MASIGHILRRIFLWTIAAVAVAAVLPTFLVLLALLVSPWPGNIPWYGKPALVVAAYWAYRLWARGRRHGAVAGTCFAVALFLGSLGWSVHPRQVLSRAADNVFYIEQAVVEYGAQQAGLGPDPPDAPAEAARARRRLREKLERRRLEYRLAEIMYNSDFGWERRALSWLLWAYAGLFFVGGALTVVVWRVPRFGEDLMGGTFVAWLGPKAR